MVRLMNAERRQVAAADPETKPTETVWTLLSSTLFSLVPKANTYNSSNTNNARL